MAAMVPHVEKLPLASSSGFAAIMSGLSQVCKNLLTSFRRYLGKDSWPVVVALRVHAGLELVKFEAASLERPGGIMQWTAPAFEEVCLNCEINSYVSAKL